jgi:hypothetical protein
LVARYVQERHDNIRLQFGSGGEEGGCIVLKRRPQGQSALDRSPESAGGEDVGYFAPGKSGFESRL